MASLLHMNRFPLRFFHYRRLATLQHHLEQQLSSPFVLFDPHYLYFSSSSRSFSSVVDAGCITYTGVLANHKASFVKSSIKPCSYGYEKEFLIHPFSSSSVSDLQPVQTEMQNLMDKDNTSKEEEVVELESDDDNGVELGVTETSCYQVNPNEWQNGPFVFKIIDHPGDMKITLEGQCDLSESIKVVVHLPDDGHAYYERDMIFDVSVVDKTDQRCFNYDIHAYSGLHNFDCYSKVKPEIIHCRANRLFLKARGIDMSLEIFLRGYLVKKYLREDLIPREDVILYNEYNYYEFAKKWVT